MVFNVLINGYLIEIIIATVPDVIVKYGNDDIAEAKIRISFDKHKVIWR